MARTLKKAASSRSTTKSKAKKKSNATVADLDVRRVGTMVKGGAKMR
jgi:hypothetical protein